MFPPVLTLWLMSCSCCHLCPRPPEVLFATLNVDKKVYEVGEEVEYTCRPGFMPNSGQRKYTCLPTGKWAFNTLLCLPKRCPPPPPLQNGKMDFEEFQYQSTVTFSSVTCAPPSLPEFGVISFRRLHPGNVSHFLDTIQFECVPPLALIGNETATCMANGTWSSIPVCKVVNCPTPIGIENGFIEFAVRRTYHYNESVSFGCQPGFVMEGSKHSRCENTGNWSTKPVCRAPCKIPVKKAVVLYNGEKKRVQNDLKDGILHGETVSFFCKNKEKSCAYTVDAACVDGNFTLPACFKGMSQAKDPSEMKACEDEA
uniref:Beta-2-glycoprotein 1 n=1 Tax=Geospiza parvula TaxID=87175 RepID=A0A8C3N6T3_GEOPR